MTRDDEQNTADSILADYSRKQRRLTCIRHKLSQIGKTLASLGYNLQFHKDRIEVDEGPAFKVRDERGQASSGSRMDFEFQDIADLLTAFRDAERDIQDLARSLLNTEHAHLVKDEHKR